jgi:hypothetical protein
VEVVSMRRWVAAGILLVFFAAERARASDWFGADAGWGFGIGKSAEFATDGGTFELRYRHYNEKRSAFEIVGGYLELGLEGDVQETVAFYENRVRYKNQLAQLQGGPGAGYLMAEFGVFETTYLGVNLLVHPFDWGRFRPFFLVGGGGYSWRLPFRLRFYGTPFFGEQRAYDEPAEGLFYAGVVNEDYIDYTKSETSGGVQGGVGASLRISDRLMLDGVLRAHLLFSSGRGNREEGIDDQDYLDDITFMVVRGGLNYRF